jgi:hypothetical protein
MLYRLKGCLSISAAHCNGIAPLVCQSQRHSERLNQHKRLVAFPETHNVHGHLFNKARGNRKQH